MPLLLTITSGIRESYPEGGTINNSHIGRIRYNHFKRLDELSLRQFLAAVSDRVRCGMPATMLFASAANSQSKVTFRFGSGNELPGAGSTKSAGTADGQWPRWLDCVPGAGPNGDRQDRRKTREVRKPVWRWRMHRVR